MSPVSPIKARPLRYPGQSVDQEIQRVIDDKLLDVALVVLVIWAFTLVEWLRVFLKSPLSPWLWTSIALIAMLIGVPKMISARRRVQALRLGRDGERVVGQFLEGLRVDGSRVFHDVPGDGFNLDHVVISTHGIFVVETKTLRKPTPQSTVRVSGEQLQVAGHVPDRNPIVQVRAAASWLARQLQESTGRALPVRGAVVYPGWFVEQSGPRGDVWVLEPKALPAFIEQEPTCIAPSDVSLAAYHLSRYIRTVNVAS